jgi:hypothetical protein
MSTYDDPWGQDPQRYVDVLTDAMRQLGAVKLVASYQGGNDEGGVQDITSLLDANGNEIETANLTWDGPLWRAADDVLTTKFGSWSGDWSAFGELICDLNEGRCYTEGVMSAWNEDTDRIEVTF